MDQLEFEELLNLIQNADESERVEVKRFKLSVMQIASNF